MFVFLGDCFTDSTIVNHHCFTTIWGIFLELFTRTKQANLSYREVFGTFFGGVKLGASPAPVWNDLDDAFFLIEILVLVGFW